MANDWTEVGVDWLGGMQFSGRNNEGGEIIFGTQKGEQGIAPMELLLVGLAGCTAVDVLHILRKKRQQVDRFHLKVRAKKADSHPKVYTKIELVYLLWGEDISDKAVRDAIDLSKEKYCSASVMLGKTAEITYAYKINQDGGRETEVKE